MNANAQKEEKKRKEVNNVEGMATSMAFIYIWRRARWPRKALVPHQRTSGDRECQRMLCETDACNSPEPPRGIGALLRSDRGPNAGTCMFCYRFCSLNHAFDSCSNSQPISTAPDEQGFSVPFVFTVYPRAHHRAAMHLGSRACMHPLFGAVHCISGESDVIEPLSETS